MKTLPLCPIELITYDLMKWHSTGYEVVGHIEEGKELKIPKVEYHETSPRQLIA
jgi:hypothetical protein